MPGEDETTFALLLFRISSRPLSKTASQTSGAQPAPVARCGTAAANELVIGLTAHSMVAISTSPSASRRPALRSRARSLVRLPRPLSWLDNDAPPLLRCVLIERTPIGRRERRHQARRAGHGRGGRCRRRAVRRSCGPGRRGRRRSSRGSACRRRLGRSPRTPW